MSTCSFDAFIYIYCCDRADRLAPHLEDHPEHLVIEDDDLRVELLDRDRRELLDVHLSGKKERKRERKEDDEDDESSRPNRNQNQCPIHTAFAAGIDPRATIRKPHSAGRSAGVNISVKLYDERERSSARRRRPSFQNDEDDEDDDRSGKPSETQVTYKICSTDVTIPIAGSNRSDIR